MHKPNCNCNNKLIKTIKEKNNLNEKAFVYFRDENIFGGALASVMVIEEKTETKSGKMRNKNSHVSIVHSYCPFCGAAYLTDSTEQNVS